MQTLLLNDFIRRHNGGNSNYVDRFFKVLRTLPPLSFSQGPWLAGGAVRRLFDNLESEGDYDLFFRDEEQLFEAETFITSHGNEIVYDGKLNTTIKVTSDEDGFFSKPFNVQLVKLYFESPEELLKWFDYTNCQFMTDGNTVMMGDYTLFDVGRKVLRLNNMNHGVSTVRRMLKYANQGYRISNGTIVEILQRISNDPTLINDGEISYEVP